jgi:hypothetical protein
MKSSGLWLLKNSAGTDPHDSHSARAALDGNLSHD